MVAINTACPRVRGTLLAVLLCTLFITHTVPSRADDDPVARHRAVTQTVLARLLAEMERPDNWDAWPPRLEIIVNSATNADAGADWDVWKREGKLLPVMRVYTGEIETIANFDPDVLAFTVGHELGHLALGHVQPKPGQELDQFLQLAFRRQHEVEADMFGMRLVLKAGFSRKGVDRNLTNSGKFSSKYSSYEGSFIDHPAWTERRELLDHERAQLWHSMSAFDNGVLFLACEQYANAVLCWLRVTKEYPECPEAWANLGYAQLMLFCDALEPGDLRAFDLGQIVVGGFYHRSEYMEAQVRGIDPDRWLTAVDALREALRLNPKLILAKANLAVAYLLRPEGKDLRKANQQFDEIAELLKDPEVAAQLDPPARLALAINTGVAAADLAVPAERNRSWTNLGQRVEALVRSNPADEQLTSLSGAAKFNLASTLAFSGQAADQQTAITLWTEYLSQTPDSALWWPVAYEKYVALSNKQGIEPKSRMELVSKRQPRWRLITELELSVASGESKNLALATDVSSVSKLLGPEDSASPVIRGLNLQSLAYGSRGLRILAGSEVMGIALNGPNSPHLRVRSAGIGSTAHDVYVGMSAESFQQLFGSDRPFGTIDNAKEPYRFYHDLGLAVRFKGGEVAEIVIAPLTRASGNTKS